MEAPLKKVKTRDFPSGPVARIPNAGGLGSIPGQELDSKCSTKKPCILQGRWGRACVTQPRPGSAKSINKNIL